MIRNVIPFFLDKPSKEVNSTYTWDGSTSFIDVKTTSGAVIVTLPRELASGDKIQPGTLVCVGKSGSNTNQAIVVLANANASLDPDFYISHIMNPFGVGCFMFKNDSEGLGQWVVLSSDTPFTGGTVSESVLFNKEIKMDLSSVVASTGTTAGDAADVSFVQPAQLVSSDGATKGVKLSDEANESVYKLINTSAVAMKVYPDGTGKTTINGSASYTLAANAVVDVIYDNSTAIYIG